MRTRMTSKTGEIYHYLLIQIPIIISAFRDNTTSSRIDVANSSKMDGKGLTTRSKSAK